MLSQVFGQCRMHTTMDYQVARKTAENQVLSKASRKRASCRLCHNGMEASLAVKRSFDRLLVSPIRGPSGAGLCLRRRRFCAATCRPTACEPCPAPLPSCAGCCHCRLRLAVPGSFRRQWFERLVTVCGPAASLSGRVPSPLVASWKPLFLASDFVRRSCRQGGKRSGP